MTIIQTPRLILRSPEPKDDARMREILSDKESMKYLPMLYKEWTMEEVIARRCEYTYTIQSTCKTPQCQSTLSNSKLI